MERGELPMNAEWFQNFNNDLHSPTLWKSFYALQASKNSALAKETPPLPKVDGEWLFWEMMRASRAPDPWMYPALKVLKASGKYIVAALSNTMIFPPDHEFSINKLETDPRNIFDVFISSAHVGSVFLSHQESCAISKLSIRLTNPGFANRTRKFTPWPLNQLMNMLERTLTRRREEG
jgi:hypothetical protein